MKSITKIRKTGNSLAIIIPAKMARHAGLEYGYDVEMELTNGEIVVRARTHSLPNVDADIMSLGYKELAEEIQLLGSFISNANADMFDAVDVARSRIIRIAGRLSALSSSTCEAIKELHAAPLAIAIKSEVSPPESTAKTGVEYEWVVDYVDSSGNTITDAVGETLNDVWDEALNGAYKDAKCGSIHPVLSLQRSGNGIIEGRIAYVVEGRLMTCFGDTPTTGLTADLVPIEFQLELEAAVNDSGRIPLYFAGK